VPHREGVRLFDQLGEPRVAASRGYLQTLRTDHGHLCIPCTHRVNCRMREGYRTMATFLKTDF